MIDPLILFRAVHIAATAACLRHGRLHGAGGGTGAHTAAAADFSALRRRLTWTVWIALAVAVLAEAGWLVLLSAEIYGAPVIAVCLHGGVWTVLTDTRFGLVCTVRLGLALLLAILVLWPATRLLQIVAAAGLIALIALIGHAGATPGTAGDIHLASDIVHLVAAGAWLGGLPALAMLLAQARRANDPAWRSFATRATRRFSWLGIVCVAALLASGIVNSWNLLGGPRDLVTTDYGRLVLLKIGLFVAMVGIAAANRFHFTPQLPASGALHALQRNSLAETGLGLCVLLFVGALGTMSPSGHAHRHQRECPARCGVRPHPHQRGHGRSDHRTGTDRHGQCAYSRVTRGFLGIPGQVCRTHPRSARRGPKIARTRRICRTGTGR